jgi:hypothetical protein
LSVIIHVKRTHPRRDNLGRMRVAVVVVAALVGGTLAACGGGGQGATTAATQTQPTTSTPVKPPEKPVTLVVNGEKRLVTLAKVDFPYCRKKTDVCSAIRGRNYAKLSPVGKRAVIEARNRKQARDEAEREAARREAIRQHQQQQQQQYTPQPQAPPSGGGTETDGTHTG